MNNHIRSIAILALVALVALVSACGTARKTEASASASPPDTASTSSARPTTAEPIPTTPPPPNSQKSPRGNLVKNIGDEAGFLMQGSSTELSLKFVVTAITPNFQCPGQYAEPPANGQQFIAIDVTMTGGPDMSNFGNQFGMSSFDWRVVALDGVVQTDTQPTETYSCIDFTGPQNVGPSQTLQVQLVLATSQQHGYLIYSPGTLANASGWEYNF